MVVSPILLNGAYQKRTKKPSLISKGRLEPRYHLDWRRVRYAMSSPTWVAGITAGDRVDSGVMPRDRSCCPAFTIPSSLGRSASRACSRRSHYLLDRSAYHASHGWSKSRNVAGCHGCKEPVRTMGDDPIDVSTEQSTEFTSSIGCPRVNAETGHMRSLYERGNAKVVVEH